MMPRVAMAKPTERGGMPRPPVKAKGRDCLVWEGGDGEEGLKRGVERWMNQRLLKVPTCMARRKWQRRVKKTLRVQMRWKGSLRLGFEVGEVGLGRRDSSS